MKTDSAFCLGAVVFPATDSMISQLGVNVEMRGLDCLGVVIEERGKQSRVYFAALDLNLCMDNVELRDVEHQLSLSDDSFKSLSPTFNAALEGHPTWLAHWWIQNLQPLEIFETLVGTMDSLWSKEDGPLAESFSGDPQTKTLKMSFGVEELDLTQWHALEEQKKDDLILVRFLPAGMHKLEIQMYLTWNLTP